MFKFFVYKIIPGSTAKQLEHESCDYTNIVEARLAFEEKARQLRSREAGYAYGFGDILEMALERGRRGTCDTLSGFWLRAEELANKLITF